MKYRLFSVCSILIALACFVSIVPHSVLAGTTLRVLTFDIEGNQSNTVDYVEDIAQLINDTQADIVGLQDSRFDTQGGTYDIHDQIITRLAALGWPMEGRFAAQKADAN